MMLIGRLRYCTQMCSEAGAEQEQEHSLLFWDNSFWFRIQDWTDIFISLLFFLLHCGHRNVNLAHLVWWSRATEDRFFMPLLTYFSGCSSSLGCIGGCQEGYVLEWETGVCVWNVQITPLSLSNPPVPPPARVSVLWQRQWRRVSSENTRSQQRSREQERNMKVHFRKHAKLTAISL